MNKIFKNTAIIILLVLFTSSCDFLELDREPLDELSESAFFTQASDFKLYANSFYAALPNFPNEDIQSDIYMGNSFNSISNGSHVTPATDGNWNTNYSRIRACNYLLKKYDEYNKTDKTTAAMYMGEAKFFRAFAYFNLVRRFGGVPLVTTVLDVNSPELYGVRNSRDEVLTLVIQDLEESIEVLPLENAIAAADKGRVSKGAAQAMLARVALYHGTWKKFRGEDGNALLIKAAAAAKAVMDSEQYTLFKNAALGDKSYLYFFTLDGIQQNPLSLTKSAQKEYILATKNHYEYKNIQTSVATFHVPTKKLADMFLCSDGLPIDKSPLFMGYATLAGEFQNRDKRMLFKINDQQTWQRSSGRDWSIPEDQLGNPATSGGFMWIGGFNAFMGATLTGYGTEKFNFYNGVNAGVDYPVIRLAEVLVTYAEAVFERNGSISDADLDISINRLRARVDLPNLTNAFVTANSLDMRTEIRRERTVELFLENSRYTDLLRWYIAHIELPKPILGITYVGEWTTDPRTAGYTGPKDANGSLIIESNRSFDITKNYLLPLPSNEIALNPSLEQNPNW